MMKTFEEHVLDWLRSQRLASKLVSISQEGTDWNGDTEGGFYSSFSVYIVYLDEKGVQRSWDVTGEDMGSLWSHVVGAFGERA